MTFFFSLGGAILSVLIMGITKKTKLSIVGVSILGSVAHSIGQILFSNNILILLLIWYYW